MAHHPCLSQKLAKRYPNAPLHAHIYRTPYTDFYGTKPPTPKNSRPREINCLLWHKASDKTKFASYSKNCFLQHRACQGKNQPLTAHNRYKLVFHGIHSPFAIHNRLLQLKLAFYNTYSPPRHANRLQLYTSIFHGTKFPFTAQIRLPWHISVSPMAHIRLSRHTLAFYAKYMLFVAYTCPQMALDNNRHPDNGKTRLHNGCTSKIPSKMVKNSHISYTDISICCPNNGTGSQILPTIAKNDKDSYNGIFIC